MRVSRWAAVTSLVALWGLPSMADEPATLPGTKPLTVEGDLAAKMVDGIDRFLLKKTDESAVKRRPHKASPLASRPGNLMPTWIDDIPASTGA